MKLLWLDLNSSYAHSSLALPALHAQIADDEAIEWDIVSATINENVGMVAGEVYRRRPDLLAATVWLFNHEQKPCCPNAASYWADRNSWETTNSSCAVIRLSVACSGEKAKKCSRNG